jgi:hypothetical protein
MGRADLSKVRRKVGLRCRAASSDDQQIVPTKNNQAKAMVVVVVGVSKMHPFEHRNH